jgi:uncharacterized protein (TIRG00374 family)
MLRRYATWILGILVLAALVVVVLHIGELERFAALAREARPKWIILAAALQAGTYVASAGVWHRTLAAAGSPRRLRSLVPLGLAKLFTDQALPSAGLSGTMLLARGLARRGVPGQVATETLLVTVCSFYSAYLAAVLAALGLLWLHHEVRPALLAAAGVFAVAAVAIPAGALWLKRWGARSAPAWLARRPELATLLETIANAPNDLLRRPSLLAQTVLLHLGVFMLDALTLWVVFRALGESISFYVVFVSFMMASVVTTIGPLPLGLGTFEATSVGMLKVLGVEVEDALAATLLLRGLTFWLPMLPGLWLARREIGSG